MHDTEPDTHAQISPPRLSPEQVAAMNPGTVRAALTTASAAAFQHLTITRQQTRPHLFAMTLDGLGGCTRQAAYRIAKTRPTDSTRAMSGQDRVTNLDHITTTALLPALAHVLGGQHHVPVALTSHGLTLHGTMPLYWPTAAVLATAHTTPTIENTISRVASAPASGARLTTMALAVAANQQRLPVAWLGYLRTSRGTGDSGVEVEPMTDAHEASVHRRITEVVHHADNPDYAPAEPRALEAPSIVPSACAHCPWLTRCTPTIHERRTP